MFRARAVAATFVIAWLLGSLVESVVEAQVAKIVGHGATACAIFLRDYQRDPMAERVFFVWAQGFMSGILIKTPVGIDDRLDLNPPEFPIPSQLIFVREYCASHAVSDYSEAVAALYRRLGGAQQ